LSPADADVRRLRSLLAMDFSDWRCAAWALLAFFVPLLAAPRLPLLRDASLELLVDFMGISWTGERKMPGGAGRPGIGLRRAYLLLDERLLLRPDDEEERLLPLALARSLLLLLELRLLRPLEAVPRLLLLLREGDDFDEEEELRDAMACSFAGCLL
jgi:hypothetical protein